MATKNQGDFQRMWEETKQEALELSKDISRWVKKGEKELVKLSGQAKINFDIMSLKVKKEQLLHALGREYYASASSSKGPGKKLKSLVDEVKEIDKKIVSDTRSIKRQR